MDAGYDGEEVSCRSWSSGPCRPPLAVPAFAPLQIRRCGFKHHSPSDGGCRLQTKLALLWRGGVGDGRGGPEREFPSAKWSRSQHSRRMLSTGAYEGIR